MKTDLRLALNPTAYNCSYCGTNGHVRWEDKGLHLCDTCAQSFFGSAVITAVIAINSVDKRSFVIEKNTPEHFYWKERWKECD